MPFLRAKATRAEALLSAALLVAAAFAPLARAARGELRSEEEAGANPAFFALKALEDQRKDLFARPSWDLAAKKQILGEVCHSVIQRAREGVRIANLCTTDLRTGQQSCPPAELPVRLGYARALLQGMGMPVWDPNVPSLINNAFQALPQIFHNCMATKTGYLNSPWTSEPGRSLVQATLAKYYGVANCGEMAALVFTEATHWAFLLGNFPVEAAGGINYDHAYTIFNRYFLTDFQQPALWNDDAVICDGWLGYAVDPKSVIQEPEEATSPLLTEKQRRETVGRSRFLYNTMPNAGVSRTDPSQPHATSVVANSQALTDLAAKRGYTAQALNLWDDDLAVAARDCAGETDRQVKAYLLGSGLPNAQYWVQVFMGGQQHAR